MLFLSSVIISEYLEDKSRSFQTISLCWISFHKFCILLTLCAKVQQAGPLRAALFNGAELGDGDNGGGGGGGDGGGGGGDGGGGGGGEAVARLRRQVTSKTGSNNNSSTTAPQVTNIDCIQSIYFISVHFTVQ